MGFWMIVLLIVLTIGYVVTAIACFDNRRSKYGPHKWDVDEAAVYALTWPKHMVRGIGTGLRKMRERDLDRPK